jgi:hypothetical protein
MSEIKFNKYVWKQHTKSEMIKIYSVYYALKFKCDLFTYLCMHFKEEDLGFISDCFIQMICCPDLDLEITEETGSKGNIDYAIVYAKN